MRNFSNVNICDWRDFGRSHQQQQQRLLSVRSVVITSRVQCCDWECKTMGINEGVKIRPSAAAAAHFLVNEGTYYLK